MCILDQRGYAKHAYGEPFVFVSSVPVDQHVKLEACTHENVLSAVLSVENMMSEKCWKNTFCWLLEAMTRKFV